MRIVRQMLALALSLMLLCSLVPSLAEEGFDMSVFNLQDYWIDANDDTVAYIEPNNYVRRLRDFGRLYDISLRSSHNFSYIYPYVYVLFDDYEAVETLFILHCNIANDDIERLEITEVEFYIDGVCYTFVNEYSSNNNGTFSSGAYYENVYLYFDTENRVVLDKLGETKQPVKVIFRGKNATVEVVLDEHVIATICDMYGCYTEGNGFSLSLQGSAMTVQSPLQKFLGDTKNVNTPLVDFTEKANQEWASGAENGALLTSLLAYDMFTANPAYADMLAYAYGSCYVGVSEDGAVHVVIQTTANTYYFVRDGKGTQLAVKAGADKMTDPQVEAKLGEFCVTWQRIPSDILIASVAQQAMVVTEYNAQLDGAN